MSVRPCSWYCDTCGGQITNPEEGYVTWNVDEQHHEHGFVIIHKIGCDDERRPSGVPLADLVGFDGLTRLLSFLSVGPLRADDEHPTDPSITNIDEFVDLIRRLQLPFYEEARHHFANSGVREAMSDANEYAPYMQKMLEKISRGEFDD